MDTIKVGRFRTIAVALVLFFGFVALVLGLSIHQLARLPAAASDPAIMKLVWFQGLALGAGVLLLSALLFHVFRNLGSEEQAASVAQAETQHILSTVNEGLFLLDRELVIGAEHSAVLNQILHRHDLAGVRFSDLLKDMVPGKTLSTALDFVELLWSDRVEADLIEDINPLNEVEAHFGGGSGAFETCYLKFSFKRVGAGDNVAHILVSVTDISAQVKLRLELQQAQAASEAQMDLLMSILHVAPDQLHSFLSEAEASLKMANSILMQQSTTQEQFKDKITQLFRAVHGVKSDAAGLGLPTIESKAHCFEDELQRLREQPELSGRDLLDLPIKLDDLLTHFGSIHSLVGRLSALRGAFEAPIAEKLITSAPMTAAQPAPVTHEALEQSVNTLVERIGKDLGKQARATITGLEIMPEHYRIGVKDIVLQLVRNALAHGIEAPQQRQLHGKNPTGLISIEFSNDALSGEYQLTVQDDGRGLSGSRIRAAAIKQGLLTQDQAAKLTGMKLLSLIFRPGFSTAGEVGEHAGRGVGLDLVKATLEKLGGRIGVAAESNRFTRFKVTLPAQNAGAGAAAA